MVTTKVTIQLLIFVSTVEKDDVDMACICRLITPKDEEKIDVEKIVFIAHICHKRVPKGEKCVSKYLTL
ncbi:hypothetical protein SETIT_7G240900v2 [Setaria italica]|uniref:Bifunctional inhibitor/plant lipid transfer protein/seed storage helical domain-containing protein n=1 Tax=Setaria italica TaxID=4555 RepID=A0A368RZ76_SETIT|nr:hypothetical protein SETIT_7G240900v2 [Setaria italica]